MAHAQKNNSDSVNKTILAMCCVFVAAHHPAGIEAWSCAWNMRCVVWPAQNTRPRCTGSHVHGHATAAAMFFTPGASHLRSFGVARQSHIKHQNGATSGFEMWFPPSTFDAGSKSHLESSI